MYQIPKDTSVKNLLTDIMPNLTKKSLSEMAARGQTQTGEISLTMEVSGDPFSYRIKSNEEIEITEGELEAPMVRVVMSNDDLEKMIVNEHLDLLLGLTTDLNEKRAGTIRGLSGKISLQLGNEDGSAYAIQAKFNDADAPAANISMKTSDSLALMRKEANPVSLFMTGALKLQGDMSFAMRFQNLIM